MVTARPFVWLPDVFGRQVAISFGIGFQRE